jgi:DNA-directed RNA polymerase specialized sigma24 family protein
MPIRTIGGMPISTTNPSLTFTNLAARLDMEWMRLRRNRAALRRADGWGIVEAPLSDLAQVLGAVGYEVASTTENEAALRSLVRLAGADELAARAVIQRLLPGLLAVAAKRRVEGTDVFDELVGAAWISIRTFNGARRPACLAAALIADADYRAFRKQWRRAAASERPTDSHLFDEIEIDLVEGTDDELAAVFRAAVAGGLPVDDLDLLRRLAAATPTAELASRLDVTPRTVRNRRDRATERLRQIVMAA